MAEQIRPEDDLTLVGTSRPRRRETSDTERERVRSSNDRDQALEREDRPSRHNEGYDEIVRGEGEVPTE